MSVFENCIQTEKKYCSQNFLEKEQQKIDRHFLKCLFIQVDSSIRQRSLTTKFYADVNSGQSSRYLKSLWPIFLAVGLVLLAALVVTAWLWRRNKLQKLGLYRQRHQQMREEKRQSQMRLRQSQARISRIHSSQDVGGTAVSLSVGADPAQGFQ